MRKYALYQHPAHGLKVVKEGFSWPGFLFGGLWLLSKRLFAIWLGFVVLGGVLGAMIDNQAVQLMVAVCVALAIGGAGNGWWGEKLVKLGYLRLGDVEAANRDQALAQGAVAALKAA